MGEILKGTGKGMERRKGKSKKATKSLRKK